MNGIKRTKDQWKENIAIKTVGVARIRGVFELKYKISTWLN